MRCVKTFCPKCKFIGTTIKHGFRKIKVFTKSGWQTKKLQRFKCLNCSCVYCNSALLFGMFDVKVIEYAAYMYLRSISFHGVVDILQCWFEQPVFSKKVLIKHIGQLASTLPSNSEITNWLKPKRSGYYALDGTYLKYRGRDFVLLIIFDVKYLDILAWQIAIQETEQSYTKLLEKVETKTRQNVKGLYCDGDPGLLKALKTQFPGTPIQLCVFHKLTRSKQIIPFVRARSELDREIRKKVCAVLFAQTKDAAINNLKELKRFARQHESHEKLQQIIGVLKRNFKLLLTHFDHPEMSPYNNVLEGFNYIVKRKTNLMKGFKKPVNISKWIKLIMLDWRFHKISSSRILKRNGKSPLELAGCELPIVYNWLTYVRKEFPRKTT